jgi:hypothetical protein
MSSCRGPGEETSLRNLRTKPGLLPGFRIFSDKAALQNSSTPSLHSRGFEDEDDDEYEDEVSLPPNREDQGRIVPVPLVTKTECQRFWRARFIELA